MKKGVLLLFIFLSFKYSYSQFPKYLYGTISYYGDEFKGKRTASGELFDPNKYTAAHRELPFGSEILVENLENGRKVKLIVNDRGPFVANRILDVSKIAAEELGFLRKGTAYAKITILKIGDNRIISYTEEGRGSALSSSEASSVYSEKSASKESSSFSTTNIPQTRTPASFSTNFVVITKTNEVYITNTVVIPLTNVVEIPPYTEKIVEQPITQKAPDDEFILEEPEEFLPFSEESTLISSMSSSVSSDFSQEAKSSVTSESFELMEREAVIEFSDSTASSSATVKEITATIEGKYYIQVGAYKKESNALRIYDLLRKEKFPVFVTEESSKGKKWIKVRVGYFNSKESAENTLKKLEQYKLSGIILTAKQ